MVNPLTNPLRERPLPLGSLLNAAGQRLSAELDEAVAEAGFADVRAAHAPVFMAIDPDGTRVTDLAQRAAVSKQAMGELIRHLAAHGYLTVETDPVDRRAKRVRLTERGWAVVEVGEHVIASFDAWLADGIGAAAVGELRASLHRIIAAPPRVGRSAGDHAVRSLRA
ncbi:MarR family winged helix-turn-helix transcriptional regulator [Pseudonocardia sp. CA-107938]|uniref:MarR family winged helix-turn-helix transcriptional regulator n=1 Tax=Pseudonocardia sp. CA-107938 TaxID=3240021 RepID=UPI003D93AA7B